MEKRALILALALTLPLALYGIPFAYAAATQSTYVVEKDVPIARDGDASVVVQCSSPSDSTQHFAIFQNVPFIKITVLVSYLNNNAGSEAFTNDTPNGWSLLLHNSGTFAGDAGVQIICQSPITSVAGIGVPEFGSLYVAIALGAVIYFALSRQHAGKRAATRA